MLVQLLQQKYPDHQWDKVLLLRGRYAQQKRLERAVAELFPVGFPYHSIEYLTQSPTG